ncbi:hypothetical protein [Thiomonas intermedia]|uniref:hypothetical protein n=1 Tax=Thiomonas intermedia TaxID=926 RepID=UPI0009A4C420|nr:hypothetical protein [Thiomonas intermedia]
MLQIIDPTDRTPPADNSKALSAAYEHFLELAALIEGAALLLRSEPDGEGGTAAERVLAVAQRVATDYADAAWEAADAGRDGSEA